MAICQELSTSQPTAVSVVQTRMKEPVAGVVTSVTNS